MSRCCRDSEERGTGYQLKLIRREVTFLSIFSALSHVETPRAEPAKKEVVVIFWQRHARHYSAELVGGRGREERRREVTGGERARDESVSMRERESETESVSMR